MGADAQRIDRSARLSNPLGAHVSLKNPDFLLGSVRAALAMDATAFMVFLGPPRNTRINPADSFRKDEALRLWEESGRDPRNIAVHFRYVLNPASPDDEIGSFAAEFFDRELTLMDELGLSLCCFHPGSSKGEDRLECARKCADRLGPVFARHPNIRVGIETMAGKGSEVGVGLVEVGLMVKRIDLPNVGCCLDTCHLWDCGLDIQGSGKLSAAVSDTVGLNRVFLIHLNDSANPRGAHRDRHARLGEGYIGFKDLAAVVSDPDFRDVPKILETPDPGDGSGHAGEIADIRAALNL